MARPHKLIVILSAFWITQCLADYYSPVDYDSYYQVPVYYQYSWEVKDTPSGNDYRQQETRDGHLTTGLYQVLLPGGRHQTVNYRVDKDSGFMADVSYQGESNYFTFKSNYQPDQTRPKQPTSSYNSYPAEPVYDYPPVQPAYSYPSQEPSYNYPPAREPTYNYPPVMQQEPESYYYPPQQTERPYYSQVEKTYPTESPIQQQYQPQYSPQNYRYEDDSYPPASYPAASRPTSAQRTTTTMAPLTTELAVTDWITESTLVTESTPSNNYESRPDYSVPMYPLYRADVYSARAKSGKSMLQQVATPQTSGYAVDEAGTTYIKPSAAYSVPDQLGTYEINHRKATARKPSQSDYQAPQALIQSK